MKNKDRLLVFSSNGDLPIGACFLFNGGGYGLLIARLNNRNYYLYSGVTERPEGVIFDFILSDEKTLRIIDPPNGVDFGL